jgi:hypothetical protein
MLRQGRFDLVIVADEPEIAAAANDFRAVGAQVDAVEADLATIAGVDLLYGKSPSEMLTHCWRTPGRGLGKGFLDQDFDDVMRVVNTNITGTICLIQLIGRDMRKAGAGRVPFGRCRGWGRTPRAMLAAFLFLRHLFAGFTRLGEANGNCLLSTCHFLAAPATFERPGLALMHRPLHLL